MANGGRRVVTGKGCEEEKEVEKERQREKERERADIVASPLAY